MGVARRVAATGVFLLSLWQLIAWGFFGLLLLLFSPGFYGSAEVSSSGRQVVLALLALLLALLNPVAAFTFLWRGTIVTWTFVTAIFAADAFAYLFFFSGAPHSWREVLAAIVAVLLLVVAFPRPVRGQV